MKRLSVLCLLVVGLVYSTASYARICFLGDLSCQDGVFAVSDKIPCRDQNPNWIHENNLCYGLVYGDPVCIDNTGNYYHDGVCPNGYTDIANLGEKYECATSLLCNKCCERVKCKDRYKICENNSKGDPNDICTEIDENGVTITKYGRCECDKNIYSFKCEGTGIDGDYSDICIDDDGETWFKACKCSEGYYQTSFSNIKCSDECKDNCRIGSYGQLPGTEYYCWEGSECLEDVTPVDKCLEPQQSDFDTFWGGYDVIGTCHNLTVDCVKLGYNTGEAGIGAKCVGGTEPYRCPFDHTQVYCDGGIAGNCTFYTKGDCELSYFGSVCSSDSSNCYLPSACKSGYVKKVEDCASGEEGIYSLGQADGFGCAACICQNTCEDKITEIPENATAIKESCTSCGETKDIVIGFTCNQFYELDENGGCSRIPCSSGYAASIEDCGQAGGWDLGTETDAAGCYSCIIKSCPEGSSTNDKQQCVLGQSLKEVGYSGNDICYKCSGCTSGYATDVQYCGTLGSEGWELEGEEDNMGCRKCAMKQCPAGSSTSPCGSSGISTETGYYSGNFPCIKCESCSKGYATSVDFCGTTGSEGWSLSTSDKDSLGCGKCTAKRCPAAGEIGKECADGQDRVLTGYSGDDACYRCDALGYICPDGQYTSKETCERIEQATCTQVIGSECWRKAAVANPCSGLSGCEYCTCMNKKYLCPSGCSDVDIIGPGGASTCQMCDVSSGEVPGGGDDSGSGGSGGGSGGISPCDPPNEYSCECKLYKDPYYCVNGAGSSGQDQGCCENFEEEDHTDDDITRPI